MQWRKGITVSGSVVALNARGISTGWNGRFSKLAVSFFFSLGPGYEWKKTPTALIYRIFFLSLHVAYELTLFTCATATPPPPRACR